MDAIDRLEEFKAKLQSLLTEYDVQVGFSVGEGSDTHGIYDERLCFQSKTAEIAIDGYWLGVSDLRDAKVTKRKD